MPPNAFFPRTRDLLVRKKTTQRHFFPTLHPLSPVIFATATVVAFVLLRNSRFNFYCYTELEATPTQKSARKWRCDLSRLLARKITKGIHSCKPVSLNRPIAPPFHPTPPHATPPQSHPIPRCCLLPTRRQRGGSREPGEMEIEQTACADSWGDWGHTPWSSAAALLLFGFFF